MFSFVVAAGIALGAESVDNIFGKRGSSCANGSCSVAAPVEVKPAAATAAKAPVQAQGSSCCSSGKTRTKILGGSCGSRLRGRCR